MNALRNRVSLIGNLGNDPEITSFENGNKVARFTIATNEYYKNKDGERVENTQWHTIVAWNNLAKMVENNLKKGQEIAVEGKLVQRSYASKSGDKRYVVEVEMRDILLLGAKKQ
jgi:single-strand DNA-binding protein